MTLGDIAEKKGCSVATLRRHFLTEGMTGKQRADALYAWQSEVKVRANELVNESRLLGNLAYNELMTGEVSDV